MSEERYKRVVVDQLDSILNAMSEDLESCSEEEYADKIVSTFEAFAESLGYLDGLACLAGVSRESREKKMRKCFDAAKAQLLKDHKEDGCPDCAGARRLWSEVHPS